MNVKIPDRAVCDKEEAPRVFKEFCQLRITEPDVSNQNMTGHLVDCCWLSMWWTWYSLGACRLMLHWVGFWGGFHQLQVIQFRSSDNQHRGHLGLGWKWKELRTYQELTQLLSLCSKCGWTLIDMLWKKILGICEILAVGFSKQRSQQNT